MVSARVWNSSVVLSSDVSDYEGKILLAEVMKMVRDGVLLISRF